MTPDELVARFRAGPTELIFDTNVAGTARFRTACKRLGALETTHPNARRVPALVHAEMLHDLRQRMGPSFDPTLPITALTDLGIDVAPFDQACADRLATHLGDRYPIESDWRAAKRKRVASCIEGAPRASGGAPCPATVDWFIAAHGLSLGSVLVTHDQGIEFEGVTTATLKVLEAALDILAPPAAAVVLAGPDGPR